MDNDTPDTPTKQCTKCGVVYPATAEYWHRHKGCKDGLNSVCKTCAIECSRQWQKNNPDKVRERNKRWADKNPHKIREKERKRYHTDIEKARAKNRRKYANNAEHYRQKARDYRAKDPERTRKLAREHQRKYREENHERVLNWQREWHAKHPEYYKERYRADLEENRAKRRMYRRQYRAKKNEAEGSHTVEEIRTIYNEQQGRCAYCGITLHGKYHADHIVPLIRSGSDYADNILCACAYCNQSKRDKLIDEWKKIRGW